MASITQVIGDGRPGGGTTAVLCLSRLLGERGHDVQVVSQHGSYLLHEAARSGLGAHGLDFASRRRSVETARELAVLLARLETDVIHAHGARAALPAALARSMQRQGGRIRRFAYTVHGFHYPAKPAMVRYFARSVERFCISRADWTNFVSSADCTFAERDGLLTGSRMHTTIKNAVVLEDAGTAADKRFDIGFVGRLTAQKNPLLLADILVALRPARPTLAVVGGGELDGALRGALERAGVMGQVTLLGECDHEATLDTLARCQVLVLPSRWEGHPITLIEAMHLGVPVVASQIPGSDEIVVPGHTGFLVPAADAHAYAGHIGTLLRDAALRQRLGDAARALATSEYSTQRMLNGHLRGYRLEAG